MPERLLIKFALVLLLITLMETRSFSINVRDSIDNKQAKCKISFGFNYHLQLSHLDIAPIAVFPIHQRVHMGFGLNYLYHYRNSVRVDKSSLGANVFSRVFITKNIYTHLEYLFSDVAYLNELIYEYHRVRKADFFIGAGYRQPLSDKTDGFLTLMININHTTESPYKNLILLKAGMTF